MREDEKEMIRPWKLYHCERCGYQDILHKNGRPSCPHCRGYTTCRRKRLV